MLRTVGLHQTLTTIHSIMFLNGWVMELTPLSHHEVGRMEVEAHR
uniref:Uncharacterized protein n=1 Tax=Picea glauca TaxID=3330 RepID=A0A101LXQ0_PICGL|nr:hypothetical protein ABT39_MTgene6089 [Picea glauca]